MSNPFNVYKDLEDEKTVDKKLRIENSFIGLENIIKVYKNKFPDILEKYNYIPNIFNNISTELKKINYDFEDIRDFCLNLNCYSKYKSFQVRGVYISALINTKVKDGDKFNLFFDDDTSDLDYMCSFLDKDVELNLKGNFGEALCMNMKRGKVFVEGNITHRAGYEMYGGEIRINGNLGRDVGCFIRGGKIFLNGTYESIYSRISAGEIYHKGKRIWRK